MESCDVLLTYEIKNRELENLCLIKRELERRGYRVLMRMQYKTFFQNPEPIEAKLVAVPAYYRPRAQFYTASHTVRTERVVNMLWEQVFNASDEENPDFVSSVKPWGRDAVHLAWGPKMKERLVREWGVEQDHACVTGHLALDFLRGPLRRYYDDRKMLFTRYGIPENKRVHLFISSLSIADLGTRVLKSFSMSKDQSGILLMVKITAETRRILLDWFERILEENPDDIIIYRPHPEESTVQALLNLAERQPRFRVIAQESVKQWILTCDKIYNWFSTSLAEVYAAGKGCAILRPVELPYLQDIKMFHDAKHIKTYEAFREEFLSQEQTHSVPEERLKEYYYFDETRYSYSLVCDVIERAMQDDRFLLDAPMTNPFAGGIFNAERIKNLIKRTIAASALMEKISHSNILQGTKFRELLDNVFYVKEKLAKNSASDEEIRAIIHRIDEAFANTEESPQASWKKE